MGKLYFFCFKDCDLKWVIALFHWVYRARQQFHCLYTEGKSAVSSLPSISALAQGEKAQTSFQHHHQHKEKDLLGLTDTLSSAMDSVPQLEHSRVRSRATSSVWVPQALTPQTPAQLAPLCSMTFGRDIVYPSRALRVHSLPHPPLAFKSHYVAQSVFVNAASFPSAGVAKTSTPPQNPLWCRLQQPACFTLSEQGAFQKRTTTVAKEISWVGGEYKGIKIRTWLSQGRRQDALTGKTSRLLVTKEFEMLGVKFSR